VEAALDASDPAHVAIAINSRAWLGRLLASLGEFAEGRSHGEEALRPAMVRQGPSLIIAHGCLGFLYLERGELEAAIRVLEAGLAHCRAADERSTWSQNIAGALSQAYAAMGRLAESLALLEETFREASESSAPNSQMVLAGRFSAVCLLAGRIDEARKHALQGLDLARQQKARGQEAGALFALGEVHTHASPPDVEQAETIYREALALAEPRGMRPLVAHCHLGLGKLYRSTGKRDQAQEHLTTATTMYREMDMRFWLERAEADRDT
jgi:tetratricopeptide (TPR) repeat protein